jgi:hypothetical protein
LFQSSCAGTEARDAGVQLIAAKFVRSARPWIPVIGTGERDLVDRRHSSPDIDNSLGRRGIGRGIDQPHVRGEWEGDPDQTVLAKVAEIAGAVAVGPEVVRVDRSKQRIVGIGMTRPPELEQLESRFDIGRRELEVVRGHVAVGARPSVSAQTVQAAVEEREETARNGAAGLAATLPIVTIRPGLGMLGLRRWRDMSGARSHQYRREHDEPAGNQSIEP